jgi:putative ABC transport system permease protein
LLSLGQGLEKAVTAQFSTLGTTAITIEPRGGGFGPPGLGSAVKLDETDLRAVQRSAYVQAAAGRILKPVRVEHSRQTERTFLGSFPQEREEREVIENFQNPTILKGRTINSDDRGKIHIGAGLSEDFGEPIEVGNKLLIEGKSFEVVGLLEKKGNPTDSAVWMNEDDARELLNIETEYSFIIANAVNEDSVNLAKEAIEKDLRKHRNVDERKEDFTVQTNAETLRTFQDILSIITGVLAGIAGISLFVGGIGIMNTMYTSVVERRKEIGIMKSIGATPQTIQTLFLIESGLLGLVGGVIGVLVGVGLSKIVEIAAAQTLGPSILQATTPLWLLFGALAFSFVVGAISGVFPARQAARLAPTEALR